MKQNSTTNRTLRDTGVLAAGLSVFGVLITLFVIPSNNYASGLLLVFLGFSFLVGVAMFLVGIILSRKRSKKTGMVSPVP